MGGGEDRPSPLKRGGGSLESRTGTRREGEGGKDEGGREGGKEEGREEERRGWPTCAYSR